MLASSSPQDGNVDVACTQEKSPVETRQSPVIDPRQNLNTVFHCQYHAHI